MIDGVASRAERRPRWQFSVRSVLVLMVAVAALSALCRVGPQLDVFVLGAAPAVLCVRHGVRCWQRRRRPSLLMIAALLPSFGTFYVVSVGPAIVLVSHYPWCEAIVERFYAPLVYMDAHTILHTPLDWYADFWLNLT